MNGIIRPEPEGQVGTWRSECPDATRAFWQVRGMARTIGVNLTAAISDGLMPRSGLHRMMLGCCLCSHRLPCTAFMARNGAGAAAAPEYCSLRPDFEALRRR